MSCIRANNHIVCDNYKIKWFSQKAHNDLLSQQNDDSSYSLQLPCFITRENTKWEGGTSGEPFIQSMCTWANFKVKRLPVVEPNASQSGVVFVDNFARSTRKRVRRELAEHVTDVRARLDEDATSALPDLRPRGDESETLSMQLTSGGMQKGSDQHDV